MTQAGLLHRAIAPFGRLLDGEGRTRRADYWPFMLVLAAIYVVGLFLTLAAMSAGLGLSIGPAYAVTAILALLAFAATVRRLHDVGWSGRWVGLFVAMTLGFVLFYFYWRYGAIPSPLGGPPSFMFYLPLLMLFSLAMNGLGLLILILALLDGTSGPNPYGPDPRGRSAP